MFPVSSLGRLVLAFFLVALAAGCDANDPSGEGAVTGTVTNSFARPVQGATVTMTATGEQAGCTTTTGADGTFSCDVPVGTYTVTIAVPGYGTQTFTATVAEDGTTTLTVPPVTGLGSIDATLINALTGHAMGDGEIECRRQLSGGSYSGVEFTATADAEGQIVITGAFTGEAQCMATAGSLSIPLQITITPTTTGTIAATPPPASGTYRVVLTWGESPRDLDSHLTGPLGGDRFHVYFGRRDSGDNNLDVDDTSSFGPETITIVPGSANGMYRYSVHNYTQQSGEGAQGIHTSGATVRLYDANGLLRTYVAPAPSASNGGLNANTWRVFEMTVNGTNATLSGAPPAGLDYQLASGAGDMTVFLTGGPAPGSVPAKAVL